MCSESKTSISFSVKAKNKQNKYYPTGTAVMQRQTTLFWWNTIGEAKLKQVFRIETAESTGYGQNQAKKRKENNKTRENQTQTT